MAQITVSFIIFIGTSLLYGYNFSALSVPAELIKEFYNVSYTDRGSPLTTNMSTFLFSFTVTLYIIGCWLGTLTGGCISKRIGRKKLVILCQIPQILGSILQSICVTIHSPESLMIGRLVSGFSTGLALQIVPVYISEISPQSVRGAMVSGNILVCNFGILLSGVFGLDKIFGTDKLWIYILLMPVIPSVLCTLFMFTMVVESPRFLLLDKHNKAEAEKSLQILRQRKDVSEEIEAMENEEIASTDKDTNEKYSLFGLMKAKEYHLPLLLSCMLPLCMQTTAISGILLYTPGLFRSIGVGEEEIQYSAIGIYGSLFIGAFLSVSLIDKVGRRPLVLFTMASLTVMLLVMGLCNIFQNSVSWLSYIGVVCAVLICLVFGLGPGNLAWVIPPELFKQGPRDVATSLSVSCIWLFYIIFAVTYEFIAVAMGSFVFIFFMAITLCLTLFFFWKLPETKNKTFEEIAAMLRRKKIVHKKRKTEKSIEGVEDC